MLAELTTRASARGDERGGHRRDGRLRQCVAGRLSALCQPISAFSKATASRSSPPTGVPRLYLDSAVEAERAEAECAGIDDRSRRRHRPRRRQPSSSASPTGASPRRRGGSLPSWLADPARGFALEDGDRAAWTGSSCTSCRHEIDAIRRAAKLADDGLCRVPGSGAAGTAAIRALRRGRRLSARAGLPRQFHDPRLGRTRRARHGAAVGPAHRSRATSSPPS